MDSCSVSSSKFGVSVGGGELRVFLLCHLSHFPSTIFFSLYNHLNTWSNVPLNFRAMRILKDHSIIAPYQLLSPGTGSSLKEARVKPT